MVSYTSPGATDCTISTTHKSRPGASQRCSRPGAAAERALAERIFEEIGHHAAAFVLEIGSFYVVDNVALEGSVLGGGVRSIVESSMIQRIAEHSARPIKVLPEEQILDQVSALCGLAYLAREAREAQMLRSSASFWVV